MKRVGRKLKQALSMFLAVAMLVTMMPQMGMTAFAEELTEETGTLEAQTEEVEAPEETEAEVEETEETEAEGEETEETEAEGEETEGTGAEGEGTEIEGTEAEGEEIKEPEEKEDAKEEAVDEETVAVLVEEGNASVIFTGGICEEEGGYAWDGENAVTFTALAEENYVITNVTYAVNEEEAKEITEAEDGTYVIEADKLAEASQIIIAVATEEKEAEVEVAAYQLAFSYLADQAEISDVKVDEIEAVIEDNVLTVQEGSTVTFKVTAKEGYQLDAVKVNDTDTEAVEGVYTITAIAADTVVNVMTSMEFVTTTEAYNVTLGYTEGLVTVSDVKIGNVAATYEQDGSLLVPEGESIKFKAKPAQYYNLKVVRNDTMQEITAGSDGYYVIENVTNGFQVYLEATLKDNVKTINVMEFEYPVNVTFDGKEVKSGDVYLTDKASISIQVKEVSGYRAQSVSLSGEGVDKSWRYYPDGYNSEKVNPIVYEFTEECTEFNFSMYIYPKKLFKVIEDVKNFDVYVSGEAVKLMEGSKDVYQVGNEQIKFVLRLITSKDSIYEPEVIYNGQIVQVEADDIEIISGKKHYVYNLDCDILNLVTDENIVTLEINERVKESYVVVPYNETEVSLTASVGAQVITPLGDYDAKAIELLNGNAGKVYRVPMKSKVDISMSARDNVKMLHAEAYMQEANGNYKLVKNIPIKSNGFSYTVTTSGVDVVDVVSEAAYTMDGLLRMNEGSYVTPVKGVYYVEVGATYIPKVYKGVNRDEVTFTGCEIKNGKNAAKTVIQEGQFTVDAGDAGKTLTVTVKDGDKVAASFKVFVRPTATNITVSGVKSGKLTQEIDCVKEYAIKINKPANANPSLKAVADNNEAGISAEIVGGKLVVYTGLQKNASAKVTITAWNGSEYVAVQGGVFTVTTKAPTLTTQAVKLVASDDESLTLNLTSKGVTDRYNKIFYKVTVKPQGANVPDSIKTATERAFYVAKDGVSQQVKLVVNNAGFGYGESRKFNVDVQLVYTEAEQETTDGYAHADLLEFPDVIAAYGNTKTIKNVATKKPWYAMSLKVKQVNKKVYTGQQEVQLATIQFDKNTTYTGDVLVEDVTGSWIADNEKLVLWVDGNKIMASVPLEDDANGIWHTGDHHIRVTAKAPDGAKAATAEFKVNVLRGIQSIHPEIETHTIYKAHKQAAVGKAKVYFNEVQTGENSYSYYYPASQKVTWEVVDTEGDPFEPGDRLYKMITVKNGVATVNKNYIVGADPYENQFRLKATAADYKGNTVSGISKGIISITSAPAEMKEAVIVKWNDSMLAYEVIARNGDSVTPEELSGYNVKVTAIRAGVEEKDYYNWDDLVMESTVISNNKAVVVDQWGYFDKISVKNGVTLTVTAKDGSKKSSKMKFNVVYEKDAVLGLRLESADVFEEGTVSNSFAAETLNQTITYTANYGKMLNLYITVDGNTALGKATGVAGYNHKLEVKNATIIYNKTGTGYYRIALDKQTAIITLTDNTTGKKMSYTLTNTNKPSTAKAPKITSTHTLACWGRSYGAEYRPKVNLKLPAKTGGYAGTYVMIDYISSAYKKNSDDYIAFEVYGLPIGEPLSINDDGTITINMGNYDESVDRYRTYFEVGTYKFAVTLGTLDAEGKFVPSSKSATVTIKIPKPSSGVTHSFKPTTSYKIKKEVGAEVTLTGSRKPSTLSYQYSNLKNAIINGQANHFTDFFELAEDGKTLRVKADADLSKYTENDLIGYVDYESANSGTVKITMKWK